MNKGDRCGKKFRYVYYHCQREAAQRIHRVHDKEDYHTKRKVHQGSVKTNSFCPSRMVLKVNLEGDLVELTYFKSNKHPITLENTVSDMKQKVNYKRLLHPDDDTSTFLMVKKLHQQDFSIILLYKPQGKKH